MQSLFDALKGYEPPKKQGAGNQIHETVEEVVKLVGTSEKYGKSYWYGVVKRKKISYSEMLGILKEVRNADRKYPKGALLTVILKKKYGKKPSPGNAGTEGLSGSS